MTSPESNSSDKKITAGISHIGITVSNLSASLKFFEALGYGKIGGDDSYPSIFVHNGSSMITLWQADEGANAFDRRKNIGLHHLAIQVPSLDALAEAHEAVTKVESVKNEFNPKKLKGTPITHAMVFEPSGNRIELAYHAPN